MRPSAFRQHRENLGLTQQQLADFLGVSKGWVQWREDGSSPVPRWCNYAIAFMVVFNTEPPYTRTGLQAKMIDTRAMHGITQRQLGTILGVSIDTVLKAETGQHVRIGWGYAIAWIRLYGTHLPFPDRLVR
jgi:DNA-binding XRE family transcriptional regulator